MNIDVIIPVYNRIAPLKRAIQSVLEQQHLVNEMIVVDDASTENMVQIRRWAENEGCRWLELERNCGPAEARNRGVAASQSRWITFLDSDDIWEPNKLAVQAKWHLDHPEFRISQVREQWVRNGELIAKPLHWEPRQGDLFSESCERCSIGPSCVMIRRDLWNFAGGFDPRYRVCEDFELWLRLTRCEKVGLVSGAAVVKKYGGHADQLSTTTPAMDRFRVLALLELIASGDLTVDQHGIAAASVKKKARILSKGAAKRGMSDRAQLYSRIEALDLTNAALLEHSVNELWGEVASG